MRITSLVLALALAAPVAAQQNQDADRKVTGGGIAVKGWKGKIDAAAAAKGMSINDSKFGESGKDLHLTVGPAGIYWKDGDTAKGTYTVGGTFKEAKPDPAHPHSYGVFIGGKDLETDTPTMLYCVAYSDGRYLVRGFNAGKVYTLTARGTKDPAVATATAGGAGVTQNIAWIVKDGTASCSINGKVVATYDQAALSANAASTDGAYGIRVTHNLDVIVSGFGKK